MAAVLSASVYRTLEALFRGPRLGTFQTNPGVGFMAANQCAAQLLGFIRLVCGLCPYINIASSILSVGGSGPFENAKSSDWAAMVDSFQKAALKSRLGIPLLYGIDAVHGNNNVYGATIFPHNIGLGATRDVDLIRRIGAATALEVRASGIHYTFAPCVAVCRDPRWGRSYESFGEDPEIVKMMTSMISGLQGQPPQGHPSGYPFLAGRQHVVACAKHFVGDGGTRNGINEGDTISSYDELEKIHMAPYLDCISQGVCTIMASYSSWNGTKLHNSHFLLTEVLKDKLGFKGFIISDSEGLDRLSNPHGSNYQQSVLSAISAGIDMVMVPFRFELFLKDLMHLVESGKVPMTRIDDAVERILRLHKKLAREAVRKSLVLLKNGKDPKKPFLPLDRSAKRILVVGRHADDLGYQCGGWTKTWDGRGGRITTGSCKLPEAICHWHFDMSPYAEFGGDSKELKIHFNGAELISVVADKFPTLVILISGRPLALEQQLWDKMEGLVAAWLPGSEGGGVVDVIFGDHEFQGRLPLTWFKNVEQLPMHAEDNSYDPLFPIGFGLTSKNEILKG
ncbi:Lysosomal beta glucosidase [Sesamum angolense]|uniref:Lysosomal beta glucosidase n=1 Tax=Sesamum angolense TaxID=2727404 RepID=A0AAE1XAG1_9LAMI|nr:Lysosomal beta glucosidase [Sesamum angolense]